MANPELFEVSGYVRGMKITVSIPRTEDVEEMRKVIKELEGLCAEVEARTLLTDRSKRSTVVTQ